MTAVILIVWALTLLVSGFTAGLGIGHHVARRQGSARHAASVETLAREVGVMTRGDDD